MNKKIMISMIAIILISLLIVPNVTKAAVSTVTLESISSTTPTGTYKTGDKITLVATFSGNLKTDSKVPVLTIKFGTNGLSSNIETGVISGNKITYNYTITDKNSGQLYFYGFYGSSLQDESGNNISIVEPKSIIGNVITVNPLVWDDFSDAKYEVTLSGSRDADLTISNITISDTAEYRFYVKSTQEMPTFDSTTALSLYYDKEKKCLYSTDLAQFVELNQDLYLYVAEVQFDYGTRSNANKYIVEGVKLNRPEYPKYASVFAGTTTLSYDWSGISINVPWTSHIRKMNVKIGKVTDTELLNKIKSTTADSFSSLLSYAKSSNNNIYSKQITSTEESGIYYNGYNSTAEVINLYDNLEDGEYYFLYVELDDENGKYYPIEGITLAKASKYTYTKQWFMFFLGNDEFKWNDFSSNGVAKDTTTATSIIPQTGTNYVARFLIFGTTILLAIVTILKFRKYKDVR